MNDQQAKDYALSKIRQVGIIDMYRDNGTRDDNLWFFQYRAEFRNREFIEINKGGTHKEPYYEVRLTEKAVDFLNKGGYAAEKLT